MQDVQGKSVLITGAGGAIGFAMARAFAAEGANLVLTDIDPVTLDASRASLAGDADVLATPGDLAKEADCATIARATFDRFGALDVLINNAAVSVYAPVWEVPVDLMTWMYEVNVLGTLHMLRQFVPAMIARGTPAHIVNIASMAGCVGGRTLGGYSASKHAVVGLTDSLRGDLAATGVPIGVTVVAPGAVKSGGLGPLRARAAQVPDPALAAKMVAIMDETEKLVLAGMEPADVARQVLIAVLNDIFWVTCPPHTVGGITMRAEEAKRDSERMVSLLQV